MEVPSWPGHKATLWLTGGGRHDLFPSWLPKPAIFHMLAGYWKDLEGESHDPMFMCVCVHADCKWVHRSTCGEAAKMSLWVTQSKLAFLTGTYILWRPSWGKTTGHPKGEVSVARGKGWG